MLEIDFIVRFSFFSLRLSFSDFWGSFFSFSLDIILLRIKNPSIAIAARSLSKEKYLVQFAVP